MPDQRPTTFGAETELPVGFEDSRLVGFEAAFGAEGGDLQLLLTRKQTTPTFPHTNRFSNLIQSLQKGSTKPKEGSRKSIGMDMANSLREGTKLERGDERKD
jgi:hypothetical protein